MREHRGILPLQSYLEPVLSPRGLDSWRWLNIESIKGSPFHCCTAKITSHLFTIRTDQIDRDLDHLVRTDQIDHDLDHLVPQLPLWEVVQDLHRPYSWSNPRNMCTRIDHNAVKIANRSNFLEISRSYRSYRSYRSCVRGVHIVQVEKKGGCSSKINKADYSRKNALEMRWEYNPPLPRHIIRGVNMSVV